MHEGILYLSPKQRVYSWSILTDKYRARYRENRKVPKDEEKRTKDLIESCHPDRASGHNNFHEQLDSELSRRGWTRCPHSILQLGEERIRTRARTRTKEKERCDVKIVATGAKRTKKDSVMRSAIDSKRIRLRRGPDYPLLMERKSRKTGRLEREREETELTTVDYSLQTGEEDPHQGAARSCLGPDRQF